MNDETTVSGLLTSFELNPEHVFIELNRTILKKNDFPTTHLKDGDILEVVHFVPGG